MKTLSKKAFAASLETLLRDAGIRHRDCSDALVEACLDRQEVPAMIASDEHCILVRFSDGTEVIDDGSSVTTDDAGEVFWIARDALLAGA